MAHPTPQQHLASPEKVPALFGCPCIWSHVPLYGAAQTRRRHHHAAAKPGAPNLLIRRLPSEVILCIVDALFDLHATEVSLGYEKYWESSCLPYEPEKYCPFCMLPRFQVWRDVANLAASCRALRELVTPTLYRRDAERNHASALVIAAKRGNVVAVRRALENGADADEDDHTMPLQWTNECFRYCDKCEYQVWWREPRRLDMGALHWAALCGRGDVLRMLLESGARADKRATVHAVLEAGNYGSLRYVEDYCDEYNASFPCEALMSGMGLRPEASCFGANALYFLLGTSGLRGQGETREMARRLVGAGSSLVTHEGAGIHALHQAAAYGNVEVLEFLLGEMKTDPDVVDGSGNTALHHHLLARFRRAGMGDDGATLEALFGAGADVNLRNVRGLSALDLCLDTAVVTDERVRIAAALVGRGAVVREQDLGRYRARLSEKQWKAVGFAF